MENAITVLDYIETITLVVSALLVYREIKISVKSQQLTALMHVDELFEEINQLSSQVYESFPTDIIMSTKQFSKKPPYRRKISYISKREQRRMELTQKQVDAVKSLTYDQIKIAKRLIHLLNNVGQYIEDDFINCDIVMGKYHIKIIRLCYLLEPVRRKLENNNRKQLGGDYGQRILRMRYKAILYNRIHSKHRAYGIKIKMGKEDVKYIPILNPVKNTFKNKVICLFKRFQYIKKY